MNDYGVHRSQRMAFAAADGSGQLLRTVSVRECMLLTVQLGVRLKVQLERANEFQRIGVGC